MILLACFYRRLPSTPLLKQRNQRKRSLLSAISTVPSEKDLPPPAKPGN